MTDVTVEATPQQSVLQPSVVQPSVVQPGINQQGFAEFDTQYGQVIIEPQMQDTTCEGCGVVADETYYLEQPVYQQPIVHETVEQGSSCGSKGCRLTNGRLPHLDANQLWDGYRPNRGW